jgi:UDP-N-acetylglucosamine--N-acetylmuramyl-(pentapeptide) pyrophosphoryl-undecaprenol N-acetylglucosamine transferase
VHYWGEGKAIEENLCREQGVQMVRPLPGNRWKRWLQLQRDLSRQASIRKPSAVFLMGGFSSFALGTWAARKGISIHLFEQNAIPGRVNRLLSLFAKTAHLTFPLKKYRFFCRQQHLSGNPVRESLAKAGEPEYDLLVFGGSQGAASLNQQLPALLGDELKVLHLCGPGRREEAQKAYGPRENLQILESHPNIPDLLRQTRWVISRAGATSLSEMAASGVAAIAVPLPTAKDNHQHFNAQHLESMNAIHILDQREMDGKASWLNELLKDDNQRKTLAANFKTSGLADIDGQKALKLLEL